jgi:hypothetical protein
MRPALTPPPAYAPAAFPDIPLPLGFAPDPSAPQVAMALGDGSLRRFDATLVARGAGPDPAVVAAEIRRGLLAFGWQETTDGVFAKGGERLVTETGRENGTATVRIRLVPAPVAGP